MNARPALATAALLAVAALTACSSPSGEPTPAPQAEEASVHPSPSISDVPSDTSAHPTTSAGEAAAAPRPTGGAQDCAPGATGTAAPGSDSAHGAGHGPGESGVCTGSGGAGTGPAGASQAGGTGERTLTVPETASARDAIVVNLAGHTVTCSLSASEASGACTADAAVWPDESGTARNQATFSFTGGGVDVHDGQGGGGYARTVELQPGETLVAYGFYRVTAGADGLTITTQTPDDGSPADPSVVGKTVRLTANAASYQG